jgi:hypothetical protein
MARPIFYCSKMSRNVREKPYGTASIGNVWVLVEYSSAWGPKVLEDSDLAPMVKRYLSRTIRNIPQARLLFIKQERAARDFLTLFIVTSGEQAPSIVEFHLQNLKEILNIDVAAVVAGDMAGGAIVREPLFLICTHGRRDKCCAKFGYALFKSLRNELGENLWQSSHVGGDRFAANLICFPHGLFYGHVTDDAGKFIAREYEQGRMVVDNYRGRACYAHVAQSAEFFIRHESDLRGLDDLRYLSRERTSENSWRVEFYAPQEHATHVACITGRPSEFETYLTCHSTERQVVIQYTLDDYRVIR